jgi:hypothetical protein
MKQAVMYYLLTLIFYCFEILVFSYIYNFWQDDIFLINLIIRFVIVIFFTASIRKTIFFDSQNFYTKISILITLNPFFASLFLSFFIFIFESSNILYIKILSDLINSILFYLILKKIA